MRAVVLKHHGGPEVLRIDDVAEPDIEDRRLVTLQRVRIVKLSKRLAARHLSVVIHYDDIVARRNLTDLESAILFGTVRQVSSFRAVGRNQVQADAVHWLAHRIIDVPTNGVIDLEIDVERGMLIGCEDDGDPLQRSVFRISIEAW